MWIADDYARPQDGREVIIAYKKDGKSDTKVGSYNPEVGWVDTAGNTVTGVESWRDIPVHPDLQK